MHRCKTHWHPLVRCASWCLAQVPELVSGLELEPELEQASELEQVQAQEPELEQASVSV